MSIGRIESSLKVKIVPKKLRELMQRFLILRFYNLRTIDIRNRRIRRRINCGFSQCRLAFIEQREIWDAFIMMKITFILRDIP